MMRFNAHCAARCRQTYSTSLLHSGKVHWLSRHSLKCTSMGSQWIQQRMMTESASSSSKPIIQSNVHDHLADSTVYKETPTFNEALPFTVPPHNRSVANWLYLCAALVGGVVCFGGITRLTESGLSIVEWKPLTGIRPPLTQAEWEAEFANYQNFPEFKQKPDMTLQEFKFIFFWEWAHRVLARSLGVVFGVPMLYYAARGRFTNNKPFLYGLCGILGLGGAQGFMGWYMVRSGLDNRLIEERKKATVSAYRLASHLFLAFLIYSAMLRMGFMLTVPRFTEFAQRRNIQWWSRASLYTMFVAAMSGAFVAGLDAGLLYNDGFPWMAGGIFPPMDHLFALTPMWKNFFENHSMVQTCHRMLAGATVLMVAGLNVSCLHRGARVPLLVKRNLSYVNAFLVLQASLGIWTIMSSVDVPVATAHQVGSLALLASLIRMCAVVGNRGIVLMEKSFIRTLSL